MKRALFGTIGAAAAASTLAWAALRPRPIRDIPAPRPAPDYAGALARVAGIQAADTDRVTPACRTQVLAHGHRTPLAIGLLHGFTNCPAQHRVFAEALYARGHNVLLPRLYGHGFDRLATDFARLTAEEMVALISETADALHGLGERTLLVGFSLGGAMAAWAAQHRPDLDHVVMIAPALGLAAVPPERRALYMNLLATLRNRFVWWDDALQDTIVGPPHAYPRYATHAVAQLLRLGLDVEAAARRQVYAAGRVSVITNPNDDVVDNRIAERVVSEWRRHGGPVQSWEFPASWSLIHDILDPTQPLQQTERVYPQLMEWIFAG